MKVESRLLPEEASASPTWSTRPTTWRGTRSASLWTHGNLFMKLSRDKLAWFWHIAHYNSFCKTPGHLGGWATSWSAEEMLDWQHQRMGALAHAGTGHDGLLQKRLEEDLCWIVPHDVSPRRPNWSRDWTKLNCSCAFCVCDGLWHFFGGAAFFHSYSFHSYPRIEYRWLCASSWHFVRSFIFSSAKNNRLCTQYNGRTKLISICFTRHYVQVHRYIDYIYQAKPTTISVASDIFSIRSGHVRKDSCCTYNTQCPSWHQKKIKTKFSVTKSLSLSLSDEICCGGLLVYAC